MSTLRKENLVLKKKFQNKISTYNKDFQDLKASFDIEKADFIDKISKLNECIHNLQTQKKDILNDCEIKINKIRSELMNIQDSKVKLLVKSINPVELNQTSRFVKLKTNDKPKSRSKSKENLKPTSYYNRRLSDNNTVKITYNKEVNNNSYSKKVLTSRPNTNYVVSNTNTNGNINYKRITQRSKDNSGLDLKDNLDVLKDISLSRNEFMDSGHNTIETYSQVQTNNIKSNKIQKKSNSCLDLLNNNNQLTIKPNLDYGLSMNNNNENNDMNKFNEINDMVFNLERNIAELTRNYQCLSEKIKVILTFQ